MMYDLKCVRIVEVLGGIPLVDSARSCNILNPFVNVYIGTREVIHYQAVFIEKGLFLIRLELDLSQHNSQVRTSPAS